MGGRRKKRGQVVDLDGGETLKRGTNGGGRGVGKRTLNGGNRGRWGRGGERREGVASPAFGRHYL